MSSYEQTKVIFYSLLGALFFGCWQKNIFALGFMFVFLIIIFGAVLTLKYSIESLKE